MVWSWRPCRKRRLRDPQRASRRVPGGDLSSAHRCRGSDRLWTAGRQHLQYFSKVKPTSQWYRISKRSDISPIFPPSCSYDATYGFSCVNADQAGGVCDDYRIRFTCPPEFCEGECVHLLRSGEQSTVLSISKFWLALLKIDLIDGCYIFFYAFFYFVLQPKLLVLELHTWKKLSVFFCTNIEINQQLLLNSKLLLMLYFLHCFQCN